MFIERSAARIRRARAIFVAVGLLPCLALAGWAAWQRSAGHRDAVRCRWQQALGLSLEVDRIEHPRPGVIRARGLAVVSSGGVRLFEVPAVEVEAGVGEDRVRLDTLRLDPAAARVIGELGREWLSRDARHPRNCVVDIVDLSWPAAGAREASNPPAVGGRLRVECVAHAGTRAVRVIRPDRDEDILRVVREVSAADGETAVERFDVEAALDQPLPIDVAATLLGFGGPTVFGTAASVCGRCSAVCAEAGWSGDASGRIDAVDLAGCVVPLKTAAAGSASIDIERLAWRDGRLVDGRARCRVGSGWIDAGFFDRLALALGCRPTQAADAAARRRFDAGGCVVEVQGKQVAVAALPEMPRALAVVDGAVLLHEPAAPVPFERLAWVLSPPTADFVPAGGAGAWLMSIRPAVGEGRDARLPRDPPARPEARGF